MTKRQFGIGTASSHGMALAIAAAIGAIGDPLEIPRRDQRRKGRAVRRESDRSKKQYILKGVRP